MLKQSPLLNPTLVAALAAAGHGDLVVVADAGLPIPPGPEVVDLALIPGHVSFLLALHSVLNALHVESMVVARESDDSGVAAAMKEITAGIPTRAVSHAEFKDLLPHARVVIRTGECTPFANAILVAGTSF